MGIETDFTAAWRQRREGALISLSDLLLPMAVAFVPCLLLPSSYMGEGGHRLLFALFVATIMTIRALPVTARVTQDLNLYRTDTGLLILCALTINDVAGWFVFAGILGFIARSPFGSGEGPGVTAPGEYRLGPARVDAYGRDVAYYLVAFLVIAVAAEAADARVSAPVMPPRPGGCG